MYSNQLILISPVGQWLSRHLELSSLKGEIAHIRIRNFAPIVPDTIVVLVSPFAFERLQNAPGISGRWIFVNVE